ncbi:uncharacterized protein [Rutidosis leptorrhynchoides]|uniref:uncharacterized protein n=1 Tax=Rutidosis leptorrhynchoides TaxID=125765 RepID=UPI003A9993E1
MHHYRVEVFYTVIDAKLQELNNYFNETSTELLCCVACLNPNDTFSAFDKLKLIRLSEIYSWNFTPIEVLALDNQLENYIVDMRLHRVFSDLKGIEALVKTLVKTKKNIVYPLVYRLVKLALILSVATATMERVFSVMKIVKTRLKNRIGDEWMNNCLITFIEKDIITDIGTDKIIQRFQNMKYRRGHL